MSRLARRLRRLIADPRGVTVVEFGFVSIPLCLMLLVFTDFSWRMYLQSMVDGTIYRAARKATIGNQTSAQIDAYVKGQILGFSKTITTDNIVITKKSYYDFSHVNKAEKITSDTAPIGTYNIGDCYEDSNNNGVYDGAGSSGTNGVGGSDDIVYYTVTVTFPRIVPLSRMMGWGSNDSVSSTTVLRNQPYAAQTTPTIRCS